MNAFEYSAKSPMMHWTWLLMILVLPFSYMPNGGIKAVLGALLLTLLVIAFFDVAPPFVTRREVEHANKNRKKSGSWFEEEPVLATLLHRVVIVWEDSGKRERRSIAAKWATVR